MKALRVTIQCPQCGLSYRVKLHRFGKRVRCKCQHVFRVTPETVVDELEPDELVDDRREASLSDKPDLEPISLEAHECSPSGREKRIHPVHRITSDAPHSGWSESDKSDAIIQSAPAVALSSGLLDEGLIDPHRLGDGPMGSGINLSGLLRHKWLMLVIFVLLAAPSVPLIWRFVKPEYGSTALVRVTPIVPRVVYKTEDNGIVPLYRSFLNSQVSEIRNEKVLQRVLDRPEIQQTQWYQRKERTLSGVELGPIERLKKALSVKPRRDTEFIGVSFSSHRPQEAKLIVDAVIGEYKKYVDENLRALEAQLLNALRQQKALLLKQIEGLVETRANLSRRLNAVNMEALHTQLTAQLLAMQDDKRRLSREAYMLQWYLDQLADTQEQDPVSQEATTQPAADVQIADMVYSTDPQWYQLQTNLKNLEHALEVARQEYGDAHPKVRRLLSDIEHAGQLLQNRQVLLEAQWQQNGASTAIATEMNNSGMNNKTSLKQFLAAKQQEIQRLSVDIEDMRQQITEVGQVDSQILAVDRELNATNEQYEYVRRRLEERETESKAPARIQIASHGSISSMPDQDRRPILAGMALFGAAGVALAVGYLRQHTDQKIYGVVQMVRPTAPPFLGQLPLLRKSMVPTEFGGHCSIPMISEGQDSSMPVKLSRDVSLSYYELMERTRIIRTALLENLRGTQDRVILMTSPRSLTGKTSVSVLLAKSLSLIGKKVLLVEADLHRPALAGRLALDPTSEGLASLLVDQISDDEAIRRPEGMQFDVVTVGEWPDHFTPEVLANGVFSSCLDRWRNEYDIILLDGPPALMMADARILAGQADCILMVLRSLHDRYSEVMKVHSSLQSSGSRFIGTVLIGGKGDEGEGYGYGQGYGYGYGYGRIAPLSETDNNTKA